MLTLARVVESHRNAVQFAVIADNAKAHAFMKGDGAMVHRRCDASDFTASMFGYSLEEMCIQPSALARGSVGMCNTDQVNCMSCSGTKFLSDIYGEISGVNFAV